MNHAKRVALSGEDVIVVVEMKVEMKYSGDETHTNADAEKMLYIAHNETSIAKYSNEGMHILQIDLKLITLTVFPKPLVHFAS